MQVLQNLEANQADLQPSDTESASSYLELYLNYIQPLDLTNLPDYWFIYVEPSQNGEEYITLVPHSTHEPPTK